MQIVIVVMYALFLSTLSLRRATHRHSLQKQVLAFLSTLSLRRATAAIPVWSIPPLPISIHALLAESDKLAAGDGLADAVFLSTLSLRRATFWSRRCQNNVSISIHALLAESDFRVAVFQHAIMISIHALLAESDGKSNKPADRN